MIQRTTLLNRLLVDLYGEQRVLKEKLLPAGPRVRQPAVPAAVQEHRRARRPAPALRRVRSRALGRRAVVGAQRPHAGAVGRGLRAREPRRRVAVPAGAVRRAQRAPARELLPRVQRAIPVAVEPRSTAGRVPVAGPLAADVLRARVSRALSRLQRRRRLGPDRSRRPRIHEDRRGTEARRPHHAAHQRGALRSPRAAHRLAARRAGPAAGRARRPRDDRQLARQRPRRERRVPELPAGPRRTSS